MKKKYPNDEKAAITMLAIAAGAIVLMKSKDEIGQYIVNKYNHENNSVNVAMEQYNAEIFEKELKVSSEFTQNELAFYIQQSKISMDGSIKNPIFFGQLPTEVKNQIVEIKDNNKELLKEYLNFKIQDRYIPEIQKLIAQNQKTK